MPIYEYECEKCGKVLEVLEPIHKHDSNCPKCTCGGITRRKFSKFSIDMGPFKRLENQPSKIRDHIIMNSDVGADYLEHGK